MTIIQLLASFGLTLTPEQTNQVTAAHAAQLAADVAAAVKPTSEQLAKLQRETAFKDAGIADADGQAVAEWLYDRLPAENKPALGAWLGTLKGDKVPRALAPFMAQPATTTATATTQAATQQVAQQGTTATATTQAATQQVAQQGTTATATTQAASTTQQAATTQAAVTQPGNVAAGNGQPLTTTPQITAQEINRIAVDAVRSGNYAEAAARLPALEKAVGVTVSNPIAPTGVASGAR